MGLHTVAVTGASGHIGANVIRELVARGRAVRALVHEDRRAIDGVDCEVVAADLRDTDSLRRAFDGAETVYHLAGHISILMTDWERTEAINVGGTRNVLAASAGCTIDICFQVRRVDINKNLVINFRGNKYR